ncbi:hypothetical protein D3C76_1833070 [compost metagenome]
MSKKLRMTYQEYNLDSGVRSAYESIFPTKAKIAKENQSSVTKHEFKKQDLANDRIQEAR